MRIIDTLNLGTNIKITMVEINNFIYILAINNNTIEVVDKILEEEFEFKNSWGDLRKTWASIRIDILREMTILVKFKIKLIKF